MRNNHTKNGLIVGLDIGTTKIATVVGYRNDNGQIDVVGHGLSESTGVEFGEIKNITYTSDGILRSVNLAQQRSNHQIDNAYVGIAGHHIKTSKFDYHFYRYGKNDNEIHQEEIDDARELVLSAEVPDGEQIIDAIPQRYLIDNERTTFDPVGEMGTEIKATYQIITGKKNEIRKITMCGERTGIEFNEIILEPIASSIACLSEEEKRKGCVLVDIGGGTSDLIIYIDGSPVYTKVISLGGNIITRDIATVCKISDETAEQLKIKYGTCIVDKSNENNLITIPRGNSQDPIQINENYLAQIINCRVQEELLKAIQTEIINSGYQNRLFSGLVLTGGGAKLKHLKELCQYVLQLPVRIGLPDSGFSNDIPSELKNPMYATALGLLKYGIEIEDDNLEQEEENKSGLKKNIFTNGKNDGQKKGKDEMQIGNGKEKWGIFRRAYDWLHTTMDEIK